MHDHGSGPLLPVEEARKRILDAVRHHGPISRAEWTVGTITAITASAWVTRPLFEAWVPSLTDTGIAIAGGGGGT